MAFGYGGSRAHEEHRAIQEKLRQAQKVLVRYEPSDPSRAVLAAGFNRSTILILIFAITWLLFTTGFTFLWTLSSGQDSRILEQIHIVE